MNVTNVERQAGQSLVLIALMMMGFLAFLGLVIDGGATLVTRRRGQDAADSAAFAGARVLAMRPTNGITVEQQISNTIATFAYANRVSSSDVTASFIDQSGNNICRLNNNCNGVPTSPLATGVRVTTTLRFQPYFINIIIGNSQIPIQSIAAAQSGTPTASSDLMPVVVPWSPCPGQPYTSTTCTQFTYGSVVTLQGGQTTSGGFQWLTFNDCSGNGDVADYLSGRQLPLRPVVTDPTDQYINTPDMPAPSPWVCGNTGFASSNAVRSALDDWLNPALHPSGAIWTVPVFNSFIGTGNSAKYHIVLFAEFQLLGYDFNGQRNPHTFHCPGSGNNKCIQGMFLRMVKPLQMVPGLCNNNGLDMCSIGLSQ